MTRIEPPRFDLPEPIELLREPQRAVLLALDGALLATTAALDARHDAPHIAGWAPDAPEDVRLAAAIVSSARTLRQLLAEYDLATHVRSYSEIPF